MQTWPLALLLISGCLATIPDNDGVAKRLECDPCGLRISEGGHLWEPHTATNPRDPMRLAAAVSDGLAAPVIYHSADGGASWSRAVIPWGLQAEAGSPASTWTHWGDPALAWLPDGTLVLAGLGNRYAGQDAAGKSVGASVVRDIFVARSHDGGATFPEFHIAVRGDGGLVYNPVTGAEAIDYRFPDREFIAAGPDGSLLLTWNRLGYDGVVAAASSFSSDLMFSRSTDGGRTWSEPAIIEAGAQARGPYPLVLDDGTMLVAYGRFTDQPTTVARSTDQGQTWDMRALGSSWGAPVIRAKGAAVALVYPWWMPDQPRAPAVAFSEDGGNAWSEPLVVARPKQDSAAHVAGDWVEEEFWIGWYHADEALSYRVARVTPAGVVEELILADDMQGDPSAYGDYVFGIDAAARGATVTYVAGDEAGRWLQLAHVA